MYFWKEYFFCRIYSSESLGLSFILTLIYRLSAGEVVLEVKMEGGLSTRSVKRGIDSILMRVGCVSFCCEEIYGWGWMLSC